MSLSENLERLCEPYEGDLNYFRPLVCKGDIDQIGVFIVGINPANAISSNEIKNLQKYASMLANYDDFDDYYVRSRKAKGKRGQYSRTRLGINSMVGELSQTLSEVGKNISIAETNVIPYPTSNIRELLALKKSNPALIDRAKQVFIEVLNTAKPDLLIVHSKGAFDELADIVSDAYQFDVPIDRYKDNSIEALEEQGVLFLIPLSSTQNCKVMACRHLMYFGREGQSYAGFLKKVKAVMRS